MTRKLATTAAALGLTLAVPVLADPPQITGISPFGVQRGVATEITVAGANLIGNPQFVAPFGAAIEPPSAPNTNPTAWKLKLAADPATTAGVSIVRVKTDDGISNPFLFAVGQVPQVAEAEDNTTFEAAQSVPSPVVVEGQAAGNDVDYFKFPGKKGQRIVVDAQCARIGSGVDPQVRLTTAARAYVAAADDSPGLMTDARLCAVLPEDTDYVVEISDTRYQGGGRPVYRLLIGPVPTADEVYPLGGQRGQTVGFELRGGTLPGVASAAATLDAPPDVEEFRLNVTTQRLGLAGPTDPVLQLETISPLAVDDLPELREPVDPAAPPLKAAAPIVLNGRIDPAGDEDRFVVTVSPGQRYRVRVDAAELGSALDGTLQVLGAKDAVLVAADDTTAPSAMKKGQRKNAPNIISPDPSLEVTVPAGLTEVTLALRDLEGRGGVGFPYRITVEPILPSFEIALNEAQVSVPKGGTALVGVTVLRQGYNGPITLGIINLPAGLTVRPGTVAEGQAPGILSVSAAADAAFGAVVLKVVGKGMGPGGPIVATATKLLTFAQQGMFPTKTASQTGLPAASALPGAVTLEAPEAPIEVAHGYGAAIPIQVDRTMGADGALTIAPLPLPPGLAVPDATIAEKAAEGSVAVTAAPEAALGPMTIGLTAKGKFADKDRTFAVPAVTLNVVRPAALQLLAPNLDVKAGETVELKGKVVRQGPFREPVAVKIDGLPAGLKSDPVTVAPDASDFAIKVVADPSSAAATVTGQVAIAFQVNKKDYPVPPTPLAVKVLPR